MVQDCVDGGCLEVGKRCGTLILSVRLIRAGKGTTICRTRKREGRIAVSVTDLRRSNRLRPRRCYSNLDRTWLWIGRASGHGSRLFVDRFAEWESPEADTNVRHYHARAGELARMVALGRLHACSHGEHGSVWEADLHHPRRSLRDCGGQRAARQESPWAQDRCERCGMDRGFALPRIASFQFRSAKAHPGTPRLDALSPQAGGKPFGGTQPSAEIAGECQYQAGQPGQRCVRGLRSTHAASPSRR